MWGLLISIILVECRKKIISFSVAITSDVRIEILQGLLEIKFLLFSIQISSPFC